MATTYKGLLTNNGKALIASATTANKINYSHIAVGDGNGSVPTPLETRTALVNEKARIALNVVEINPNNTNQIVCEAIIPTTTGGFYIRELGLYAGSTMVVNASYPPTYKPLADEGGAREIALKLVINIQNADVIALYLDDSLIYATREWVNTNYLRRNELVDNLTTDDATKPVSAKQAKNLKDSITAIEDIVLYAPIAWPSTTIPCGHLAMMGQTISQAQYPKLYALYGATLPDMRAYSIKGLDYGRGIDTGRTILTEQGDAIRNITGSFGEIKPTVDLTYAAGIFSTSGAFAASAQARNSVGNTTQIGDTALNQPIATFDASRVVPTATENRVKNIAFLYIVKAG